MNLINIKTIIMMIVMMMVIIVIMMMMIALGFLIERVKKLVLTRSLLDRRIFDPAFR